MRRRPNRDQYVPLYPGDQLVIGCAQLERNPGAGLTRTDVLHLTDLLEVRSSELELPEGLLAKVEAMARGDLPRDELTVDEAQSLLDLVSEFSEAYAEEPGAKADPSRVDYSGLEGRLGAFTARSRNRSAPFNHVPAAEPSTAERQRWTTLRGRADDEARGGRPLDPRELAELKRLNRLILGPEQNLKHRVLY